MSDEYKIIEVNNYLSSYFPGCEIKVKKDTTPPIFHLIRNYDTVAKVHFLRSVWDDYDYNQIRRHLPIVKLADEINNNIGENLIVKTDKVSLLEQKK